MKEIGKFRKSKNKFIVVSEDEFKKMDIVDIRENVQSPDGMVLTRSGIKFKKEFTEKLIKILEELI